MHAVELRRQPLMLARPVLFILWVCVIQVNGNSAVAAGGQFFPFQRIAKFLLNGFLLLAKKYVEHENLHPACSIKYINFMKSEKSWCDFHQSKAITEWGYQNA